MEHCNTCGAEILPQARFCGRCGQVRSGTNTSGPTDIQPTFPPASGSTPIMPSSQTVPTVYPPTQISESARRDPAAQEDLRAWMGGSQAGAADRQSENEEERRKKGMLLPPFMPGGQSVPQVSQAPMVPGAPQMGGASVVQGTPQVVGPGMQPPPNIANQPPQAYPPHLINRPAQGYPPHLANQPAQGYLSNVPNQPAQAYPQHMQAEPHQGQHMINHPASQIGKAINKPRIPGLRTAASKIVAGSVAAVVVVAVVVVATMHKSGSAGPGAGGGAAFYSSNGQGISAVRFNGTNAWSFNQSGVSFSSPVEAQGIVYTIGTVAAQGQRQGGGFAAQQTSTLYALNATDGSTLWKTALDDVAGPPTPYKDGVYVEVGMYVEAFRASDGHMSWKSPTDGGDQHPVDAVTDNAVYSLGDANSGLDCLYALNRSDGKLLWRYQGGLFENVTVDHGSLYMNDEQGVGSGGGGGNGGAGEPIAPCPTNTSLDRTSSHLYSLNANTGTLNWIFSPGLIGGPPQLKVTNGTLYLATPVSNVVATNSSTHVFALQTSNGAKLWDFNVGDHGFPGNTSYDLAVQNGVICFASSISKAVFGLQASDGTQLWKFATSQAGVSPIALANGTVYIETLESNAVYLNAVQASDGKVLWKVTNPNMFPYVSAYQGTAPGQPAVQYQLINGAIYNSGVTTTGQSVTYPLVNGDGSLVMAST